MFWYLGSYTQIQFAVLLKELQLHLLLTDLAAGEGQGF